MAGWKLMSCSHFMFVQVWTPPNKHFWQGRSSCIDEEDKNRESSRALPDLHTVIFTKFTSTEFDLPLALADEKSVENMYEQSI